MGILLSALAAAGNEGVRSMDQQQEMANKLALQQQSADLNQRNALLMEKERNIFEMQKMQSQRDALNAPSDRAGVALRASAGETMPVIAAPATSLSGNDPTSQYVPPSPENDNGGKGLDPSRTPDLIARISAMPDSNPDKQGMLDQLKRQQLSDQAAAQDAVAGQTRKLTSAEILADAHRKLMENGDPTAAEIVHKMIPDKYQAVPDGGLLNTATGEITSPANTKTERQLQLMQMKIDAGVNGKGNLPAESANAQWMVDNGVAPDAASAWKMIKDKSGKSGDTTQNDSMAQLIADGKLDPKMALSRMSAEQKNSIISKVVALDPNYDQKNYSSQSKAVNDFTGAGKHSDAIKSFNVGLAHLDQLGKLSEALDNGNSPLVNKIGNTMTTWTGGAAPSNFEAAKHIVADEIVKAVTGSGGALGDREAIVETMKNVSSPAQLQGVINQFKGLMIGQLHGLNQQYETSTSRKDFYRLLSPEARTLSGISSGDSQQSGNPFTENASASTNSTSNQAVQNDGFSNFRKN